LEGQIKEKRMDALKELVAKEFEERHIEMEPLYPRILVRVLPKPQQKNGIILPDNDQNKPTHEGVVLRVYKPFWQTWRKVKEKWEYDATPYTLEDADGDITKIWKESPVQPGDHILFPHIDYGITPVWPLDDGKGEFRLVPEGLILGRLNYQIDSTSDWLVTMLDLNMEDMDPEELAELIFQDADVVRHLEAKTISGK
jgi:hypothetical protein